MATLPRDADSDGFVYDGTIRMRPAPLRAPSITAERIDPRGRIEWEGPPEWMLDPEQGAALADRLYEGGPYGHKGLWTRVSFSTPRHNRATGGYSLAVTGRVFDQHPDGDMAAEVGLFSRVLQWNPIHHPVPGLSVYHDSLSLDEDQQGQGFASEFNGDAEVIYRELGATAIRLLAVNIGAYAWARAGYDWDRRNDDLTSQAIAFERQIETLLGDADPDERDEALRMLRRMRSPRPADWPTPFELSEFELDGVQVGKKALLYGGGWQGVKWLIPQDEEKTISRSDLLGALARAHARWSALPRPETPIPVDAPPDYPVHDRDWDEPDLGVFYALLAEELGGVEGKALPSIGGLLDDMGRRGRIPRDGDGDGLVYDGTMREMPAPVQELAEFTLKKVKGQARTYDVFHRDGTRLGQVVNKPYMRSAHEPRNRRRYRISDKEVRQNSWTARTPEGDRVEAGSGFISRIGGFYTRGQAIDALVAHTRGRVPERESEYVPTPIRQAGDTFDDVRMLGRPATVHTTPLTEAEQMFPRIRGVMSTPAQRRAAYGNTVPEVMDSLADLMVERIPAIEVDEAFLDDARMSLKWTVDDATAMVEALDHLLADFPEVSSSINEILVIPRPTKGRNPTLPGTLGRSGPNEASMKSMVSGIGNPDPPYVGQSIHIFPDEIDAEVRDLIWGKPRQITPTGEEYLGEMPESQFAEEAATIRQRIIYGVTVHEFAHVIDVHRTQFEDPAVELNARSHVQGNVPMEERATFWARQLTALSARHPLYLDEWDDEWISAKYRGDRAPSPYSRKNKGEWWAENFAAWYLGLNVDLLPEMVETRLNRHRRDVRELMTEGGYQVKGDEIDDAVLDAAFIDDDFEGSVIWLYALEPSFDDEPEAKALPRDADNDGFIYDGTLREMPAPMRPRLPRASLNARARAEYQRRQRARAAEYESNPAVTFEPGLTADEREDVSRRHRDYGSHPRVPRRRRQLADMGPGSVRVDRTRRFRGRRQLRHALDEAAEAQLTIGRDLREVGRGGIVEADIRLYSRPEHAEADQALLDEILDRHGLDEARLVSVGIDAPPAATDIADVPMLRRYRTPQTRGLTHDPADRARRFGDTPDKIAESIRKMLNRDEVDVYVGDPSGTNDPPETLIIATAVTEALTQILTEFPEIASIIKSVRIGTNDETGAERTDYGVTRSFSTNPFGVDEDDGKLNAGLEVSISTENLAFSGRLISGGRGFDEDLIVAGATVSNRLSVEQVAQRLAYAVMVHELGHVVDIHRMQQEASVAQAVEFNRRYTVPRPDVTPENAMPWGAILSPALIQKIPRPDGFYDPDTSPHPSSYSAFNVAEWWAENFTAWYLDLQVDYDYDTVAERMRSGRKDIRDLWRRAGIEFKAGESDGEWEESIHDDFVGSVVWMYVFAPEPEGKALPRDADRDNIIYEGTPRERPAPPKAPKVPKHWYKLPSDRSARLMFDKAITAAAGRPPREDESLIEGVDDRSRSRVKGALTRDLARRIAKDKVDWQKVAAEKIPGTFHVRSDFGTARTWGEAFTRLANGWMKYGPPVDNPFKGYDAETATDEDWGYFFSYVLTDSWARTASDHSSMAKAVQDEVADLFGTKKRSLVADDEFKVRVGIRRAKEELKILQGDTDTFREGAAGAALTAYVAAVYQSTQEHLKEAGIDSVTVWRGVPAFGVDNPTGDSAQHADNPAYAAPLHHAEHKTVTLRANPASSWSIERATARLFADSNVGGTLFTMTVPARNIWSMAITGPGALHEGEVIVGGSDGKRADAFGQDSEFWGQSDDEWERMVQTVNA